MAVMIALLIRAYERWFFQRDPSRSVDPEALIVTPADGRIVYVAEVEEGRVPIASSNGPRYPLRKWSKERGARRQES